MTISGLELTLIADCKAALSKAKTSIGPFVSMYSSSTQPKTLTVLSELFKNEDEVFCPVTSIVLKNRGCLVDYSGDVMTMNERNEIQARMNGIDQI